VVMGSPKRRNNLVIEQRPVKPALLHQKQRPIGASILSLPRYVPYCTSSGLVWLGGFWEISGTQLRQCRNVRCRELSSSGSGQDRCLQLSDSGLCLL
jgi:hypothetical protein